MSKTVSIADVVVHLHPDTSIDDPGKIDELLRNHDGVVSVHFNQQSHPHAVVVAYNPDAITSTEVLEEIRKCDSQAVMVSF